MIKDTHTEPLPSFLVVDQPETLRDFLDRRKRELSAQVAALRGQITPMERELEEIDIAIEALPQSAPAGLSVAALNSAITPHGPAMTLGMAELGRVLERFKSMTIKELIVQALLDAFPAGATPAQLRNFIKNAYGRDVEPASLRPQLHRLKGDGKLDALVVPAADGAGETMWYLLPKARQLYAMYDHPTSRRAMNELRDEPVSDEPPANE